jgi:hypothetical protein
VLHRASLPDLPAKLGGTDQAPPAPPWRYAGAGGRETVEVQQVRRAARPGLPVRLPSPQFMHGPQLDWAIELVPVPEPREDVR